MKTTLVPASRRPQAFTLVELLVVLAIIATLAGIAVPAYSSILRKMKNEQAKALAQQLVNAIKGYQTEYFRFPVPPDYSGGEVTPMRTDEMITKALLGTDEVMNPKRIRFLPDLKQVEEGGGFGLKVMGQEMVVVDPWGEEYNVIMDIDFSNDIDNPNPASGSPKLYQTVLVFSGGPDKDASTWEDNITTWSSKASKNSQNTPAQQ